ncbi:MAG: hypothetical protein ACFFCS_12940 [Candidatus Hodarchaeota archaeon]
MSPRKKIQFWLDEELKDRYDQMCKNLDRTFSSVIKEALNNFYIKSNPELMGNVILQEQTEKIQEALEEERKRNQELTRQLQELMKEIKKDRVKKPAEPKLKEQILTYLSDGVYPLEKISKTTGIDEDTVLKALEELKDLGIVEIIRQDTKLLWGVTNGH